MQIAGAGKSQRKRKQKQERRRGRVDGQRPVILHLRCFQQPPMSMQPGSWRRALLYGGLHVGVGIVVCFVIIFRGLSVVGGLFVYNIIQMQIGITFEAQRQTEKEHSSMHIYMKHATTAPTPFCTHTHGSIRSILYSSHSAGAVQASREALLLRTPIRFLNLTRCY
jgi:hypothetical protein